jgi:hypothetical protein
MSGFAYLATIGCQRISSAFCNSFEFAFMGDPSVPWLKIFPAGEILIENPNFLRTKRIYKTITPKYTGIIRFTD